MNKKIILFGIVAIAVVIGAASLSISSFESEKMNLDMERSHGTISTALGSPILGNPSAPITIVEFGDYQCHQCYNWFHNTKPAITSNYIETGKVNLVFVDLAFLGNDSLTAAQASYCAEDQEMYWEYHDILYSSQESAIDGGWANSERLKAFAFDLGLDMDLFESCLDSQKYSNRVDYNIQQAKTHGVQGTPGFFIVGPNSQEQLRGAQPFSVFEKILESMI